ncbi:hypothetical protein Scep_008415 [Stephania cephalantha]|uniref:Enoyl reductase (ER) domain-containing protein n=1 Tax=Stephania cephalantha TaxID=152367 RepID=A0AAP0KDF0_9MAGN
MEIINRSVAIKDHVEGAPEESDFELRTDVITAELTPGSNDVLVKNLYLSIDPYQLNRMKKYSSSHETSNYAAPLVPGKTIDGYGVGRVVASAKAGFEKGDLVAGVIGWEEYTLVHEGTMLNKLSTTEFPLSYHVGILGFSGLTAYGGFYNLCKPKNGEKVFVSAASGSVGNVVGQYAKLFGCYVIGCAGTKQKVELLKNKLGFDDAFNYKEESDLKSTLKRYFPDGIDIYFDNVGGEMLEAAVSNMNLFGRIAVCGVISEYADAKVRASPNMLDVVYKRITIQGFLAGDFISQYADFFALTVGYLRSRKLHALEDISIGIESIPSAFAGLFHGDNIGKKMVQVAEE